MTLTALEIKQQQFKKSLRGFDTTEVTAFLNVVANQYEHLVGKQRDLELELTKVQERLRHYERVESALHETLQTAKDSAQQRLESAKKDARNRVEKAENEAENMLREARQQRQEVKQSIMRLIDRREEIVRGIKSYLDRAQESLNTFARDESSLFTIPVDERIDIGEKSNSAPARRSAPQRRTSAGSSDLVTPGVEDVDDLLDDLD